MLPSTESTLKVQKMRRSLQGQLLTWGATKEGQQLDLKMGEGRIEGSRLVPQTKCEESKQLLGTVHGVKAGGCRGGVERNNIYGTSTGAVAIREGTGVSLRLGRGLGGDSVDVLTHGKTHIRCSWSRSCRPSAHEQRRRFPWNCRRPCGSLRQPACQTPAPER